MTSYPSRMGVRGLSSKMSLGVPSSRTELFSSLGLLHTSGLEHGWGRLGQTTVAPKDPVALTQGDFAVGKDAELLERLPWGDILLGQDLQFSSMGTGTGTNGVAIIYFLYPLLLNEMSKTC